MRGLLLVLLGVLFSGVLGSSWHYGDESHWHETCRTGKKQSPINLDSSAAEIVTFDKFIFSNYHLEYPARIKNNGHSVELKIEDNQPRIRGGGLPKEYILDHLHFHWKSEHTMDGYRFPLECHLVHYASDYKNLANALKYVDGVAVLGVLFDLSPDDDANFEPLIKVMAKVEQTPKAINTLNSVELSDFLPRDVAGYYRYSGSLTTPNCTEAVIWTVFTNTIHISPVQAKHFESVHSDIGVLTQNYRSLQPLGERTLLRKVSPIPHAGAMSRFNNSFIFLVILMAIIRILE